jgi:site-specific recombinase XerD
MGLSVLREWEAVRETLDLPKDAPLCCTLRGKELSEGYFRQLFPRLGHRAGIEKRCHVHGLRHRFACDLHDEGMRLADIQALLGHTNIAITSVYLSRWGADEARELAIARA